MQNEEEKKEMKGTKTETKRKSQTTKKSSSTDKSKKKKVNEDNPEKNQENELVSFSKETGKFAFPYIVGIGASAGGLEALQQLLEELPTNTGFPYIVVQHLSPDYKSLLAEILGKCTDMPVIQAENGMPIKPNCIYLIPPKNNMQIKENKLFLTEQFDGSFNHPIDIFFRSLAKAAGHRAIAIVMSGTGSDGTNGIRNIKEQDGMIIVQKPESAKFDGMPRSALRTGLVDVELTPSEIAAEMKHISYNATDDDVLVTEDDVNKLDEDLTKRIYYILKKVSNVDFTFYKRSTILRRIERRKVLTHMQSLSEYVDFLFENSEEAKILSKEVLIGVTSFFRDPDYFQKLKEHAITDILKRAKPQDVIRVWVAGCSTGEEAYSIAILFKEAMDELELKREVKIFATDLDIEAIATAGRGVYGENIIESVSPARLSRFFVRKNNTYIINRNIRKMIIFSPHNVFQDPPFGRLDLISCRNMLIYFQPILQHDLFAIFHIALKNKGYLFLGKSEAIGEYLGVFNSIDANAKIFVHKTNGVPPKFKMLPQVKMLARVGEMEDDYDERVSTGQDVYDKNVEVLDTVLLENFMPACLVINDKNEIEHTYGENSNYLHFSFGRASLGLFDTITDSLKIAVSTILKDVRKSGMKKSYKDIHFVGEHNEQTIDITAMPLGRNAEINDDYIALVFMENNQRGLDTNATAYQVDLASAQRITDLEQELRDLQLRLISSQSEQETINEELQAANEELLTANEELQSSNEELQSVNEELYTVNAEYQQKISEVADMNDDLSNFLSTTLIGIMFVDSNLNIRRFTNYISSEFGIMEHDVGRSLKFITYNFMDLDLESMCKKVLNTLIPVENEVLSANGAAYFLRVAPYRTIENKILGCVITFVDLSRQKAEQQMLENANVALNLAQKANLAKSDFLSRMSHEIRTPMNAISGMAEIAARNVDKPEVVADCLVKAKNAVKFMNSIVSDILDMSRIEQSKIDLVYSAFDLNDTINNICCMIEPQMDLNKLQFEVKRNKISPLYFGDETRLQQILINILTNAAKYTPEGGKVNLTVSETSHDKGKANLLFVIEDTGIGMKEDFIAEMFHPFTRERRGEGNLESSSVGLGLSIAHSLAMLMNGHIDVESKEGQGSKFSVYIVLDTANMDEKNTVLRSGKSKEEYSIKGLNILVAEDNEVNAEVLVKMLAFHEVSTTVVTNGNDAVNTFINSKPNEFDCILMDIRMPVLDGREAAKKIRNANRDDAKEVFIVGISADAFSDDILKSRKAGMNEHLTKPIEPNKLFETLEKCAEEKKKKSLKE